MSIIIKYIYYYVYLQILQVKPVIDIFHIKKHRILPRIGNIKKYNNYIRYFFFDF